MHWQRGDDPKVPLVVASDPESLIQSFCMALLMMRKDSPSCFTVMNDITNAGGTNACFFFKLSMADGNDRTLEVYLP